MPNEQGQISIKHFSTENSCLAKIGYQPKEHTFTIAVAGTPPQFLA